MNTKRTSVVWIVVLLALWISAPLTSADDTIVLGGLDNPLTTISSQGKLTFPGELHWYRFSVADNGGPVMVRLEAAGDSAQMRLLLFDGERKFMVAAEEHELRLNLQGGTYFLRVDSLTQAEQPYELIVYNGVESESNDGLIEADDVGEISAVSMMAASLLPPGDTDFVRFSVPEGGLPSPFNALLIESTGADAGDTVIVLYRFSDVDARFLPTAFNDDSGDSFWSRLLIVPAPGAEYAVRVEEFSYPYEGIQDYTLALRPISLALDPEPNDTPVEALPMDEASPEGMGWDAQGVLQDGVDVDYYSFLLADGALVDIEAIAQDGLTTSGATRVALYDPAGVLITSATSRSQFAPTPIRVPLAAGAYTLSITGDALTPQLTPYRLRVASRPVAITSEIEFNDDEESAQLLPQIIDRAALVDARIHPEGDVDVFCVVLDQPATVVFQTAPAIGSQANEDTVLSLYDESMLQLSTNDDFAGSRWSQIEETLAPGTYYILIEAFYSDEAFPYSLLVLASDS
ncbi:MAG TPA: hypothetical protein ENN96_01960 [Candidatus Acetothermia bacterium]|nr:hypothetical protein [Candidatus Acetothermia bacterium]